jgi:signal transduction histidine kinase
LPGFSDAADGWRLYGLPLAGGGRILYVAQTRDERLEAQAEVAWSSIVAALSIGAAGAWWLRRRVQRELQPLADLSQALGRYEPLPPAVPLLAATHRELEPVHDAIEALGQRLARRVANEQAFSAHVAHALRTPLAGIDTQLAVAQREAPPGLQPRLARAREAAGRLTRVVAALLALFRSGAELHWQTVDLHGLAARLPHEGLTLQLTPGATVQADADLLTAALINLIDNAVRHGARTLRVQVLAQEPAQGQDDRAGQLLRLQDDGRGVSPGRRSELADALRTQSYEGRMGLGLMLADLVARAHGGRLSLPEVDAGFAVDLHLGRAPVPGPGTVSSTRA